MVAAQLVERARRARGVEGRLVDDDEPHGGHVAAECLGKRRDDGRSLARGCERLAEAGTFSRVAGDDEDAPWVQTITSMYGNCALSSDAETPSVKLGGAKYGRPRGEPATVAIARRGARCGRHSAAMRAIEWPVPG